MLKFLLPFAALFIVNIDAQHLVIRPSTHVVPYNSYPNIFPVSNGTHYHPEPFNTYDSFYNLDSSSSTGADITSDIQLPNSSSDSTTGADVSPPKGNTDNTTSRCRKGNLRKQ